MNQLSRKNTAAQILLYLVLVVLMAFWGYAFVGIKILLKEMDPVNLTVLRFFFTLLAILAFMLFEATRGQFWPKLDRKTLLKMTILGFLGVVAYHLSLNVGEKYTSATVASVIVFTSPIFTLLLSSKLLGESITSRKVLGMTVAFTGAIAVVIWGPEGVQINIKSILGGLLIFVAPISWAAYTVLVKKYRQESGSLSPLYLSQYTMLFGSLILLLFTRSSTIESLVKLSYIGWINLIVLSLISSFLGYIIWLYALDKMEASKISAFLYLIPIFAQLSSWLFLNETPNIYLAGGAALVLIGIWLTEK